MSEFPVDPRAGESRVRAARRPQLGVAVVYVSQDLAEALDLSAEGGLLVQEVVRGWAAEQAGIRGPRQAVIVGNTEILMGGDLIMEIDGRAADRSDAISRAMSRKRAGDSMELTVFRNGRQVKGLCGWGERRGRFRRNAHAAQTQNRARVSPYV